MRYMLNLKEKYHTPVLAHEAIEGLCISEKGTYIDATFGGGGHSGLILEKNPSFLLAIDQDEDALKNAYKFEGFANFRAEKSNFSDTARIQSFFDGLADGVLMDLGVSSYQLDNQQRGFSYNHDGILDMRMDLQNPLTAHHIVNNYSQKDLAKIIRDYGEERWAARIAEFIVVYRQKTPINTTFELSQIIKNAIPKKARENGGHPAKRTFQAIRIEVNSELSILPRSIEQFVNILKPEGRICIITFHSLEDRIVKHVFRELENPCSCPREFPHCICGKLSKLKIITKKPILQTIDETTQNPRAKSAKLRIAQKI